MIKVENGLFVLHTERTTYAFAVKESGQLEHLYYGEKLDVGEDERLALSHKAVNPIGCGCVYGKEWPNLCLEEFCLETSGVGKGDTRTPFVEVTFADGSHTTDFVYESYEMVEGAPALTQLPSAYDETGTVKTLRVSLREQKEPLRMDLFYTVYPACDCIVRGARLVHLGDVADGAKPIRIDRLMSAQLDFETSGYRFIRFHGDWAHEMNRYEQVVEAGGVYAESRTGNSSNHANPFVMIASSNTTEEMGECYASNLIYSGNHKESLEVDAHGKSRFLTGILPDGFSWQLEPGASFEAPQAVLCYSGEGYR
ncbi:MAG: alpha-galactosidase, partial [Lachnospiraceae bacterium]|nr:alpha-galactosidase [Lachnospiraceae bacterium]